MLEIEEALNSELSTISGLSTKVFPQIVSSKTVAPYITYTLSKTIRTYSISGDSDLKEASYQIDVYQTKYSALKALMKLITVKLNSFTNRNIGTNGPYVQQIEIVNEHEAYESNIQLHKGIIEINIFYEEV